jgi:glutathione S-transferase
MRKIYQTRGCPFAHRARIVLEEKKLAYEVEYFQPFERPAVLTAVSPDAKSPTLFDEEAGSVVWNSLVVIEYLNERYPGIELMSNDALGRAHVRLAMRDVEDKLMPAGYRIADEFVHKTASERNEANVKAGVSDVRAALVPWDTRLESKTYLVGERFSLADITLFTPLYSLVRLVGSEADIPEALTNLRSWRDRIAARPSTVY